MESRLSKKDYLVKTVPHSVGLELVKKLHYSKGGSNTCTYMHGLFKATDPDVCLGVAWWIPPTKHAGINTYPKNWQGVLSLSRLAIDPAVPKNAASFLIAASIKLIDRKKWPCLVTYADEWQGHTGAIYKATNWTFVGETKPQPVYRLNGVMLSRKRGNKTRSHQEMIDLGCEFLGRFKKLKFVMRPKD